VCAKAASIAHAGTVGSRSVVRQAGLPPRLAALKVKGAAMARGTPNFGRVFALAVEASADTGDCHE